MVRDFVPAIDISIASQLQYTALHGALICKLGTALRSFASSARHPVTTTEDNAGVCNASVRLAAISSDDEALPGTDALRPVAS
jgi:hypothetical protein